MTVRKAISAFFSELGKPSPEKMGRRLQRLSRLESLSVMDVSIAAALVKKGAVLDGVFGEDGDKTPLTWAICKGHHDVVRALLARSVNVEEVDRTGWGSPLFCAVVHGRVGIVKTLVAGGADVNKKNRHGDTALYDAVERAGHSLNYPGMEMIRALIHAGAALNERCSYGNAALTRATAWGREDIIRLLVDKGSDVNVKGLGDYTALIIAAEGGSMDTVKILIDHGADIHAKNNKGENALCCAALRDHSDIVKLLHEKGATFEEALVDVQGFDRGTGAKKLALYHQQLTGKPLDSASTVVALRQEIATLTQKVEELQAKKPAAEAAPSPPPAP